MLVRGLEGNYLACFCKSVVGPLCSHVQNGRLEPVIGKSLILEAAKSIVLYKWTMKAMELDKCNLEVNLRCKLARINLQVGRSWGFNLDWFTSKQHQGYFRSKAWGHINKI